MPSQRSFLRAVARSIREAERARIAAARRSDLAEARYQRALAAEQRLAAKEYAEGRAQEAVDRTELLNATIEELQHILEATLRKDDFLDLALLKPKFDPGALAVIGEEPKLEQFLPKRPGFLQRLIPGAEDRYAQHVSEAEARYEEAELAFRAAEQHRRKKLADAEEAYKAELSQFDTFQMAVSQGDPHALVEYFTMVLQASDYPASFPRHAKVAFVPESRQVVVEFDLPPYEVVPAERSFRYVKASDELKSTPRPSAERKRVYAYAIAQITLRTIHELFEADRDERVETIVFNGYVDATDLRTGQPVRPCLVTVRVSRDVFKAINIERADALACLRGLNAGVSSRPDELAPIKPILEFSMVDPRFVEETDVLSELDQRPNLMELSPTEFEGLISNLFQRMGLETRQTRPSRDGGVDCVAYDPRPVLGGKVVIQAKRYKNTVGVGAVRDLFGTVHNEGASKGILVTTSGYGKAAFEFAEGKPLELLSGSNLLYLLSEHAGIEARIVPPEDWVDPTPEN